MEPRCHQAPHPHVLGLDTLMAPRRDKSMGPCGSASTSRACAPTWPPARSWRHWPKVDQLDEPAIVQVNTHPEVMIGCATGRSRALAPGSRTAPARASSTCRCTPTGRERAVDLPSPASTRTARLYRCTHSGWLEACVDLGTAVIAPSCGFYAQQRPVFSYANSRDGLDAQSLARAVRAVAHHARDLARSARLDPAYRLTERRWVAAEHERIYRGLLS